MAQLYGVIPKGLLTFLGILGNAEFSSMNSGSHKKVCGCFCDSQWRFVCVWFCLENIVCAIPVRVMKDQY